VKRYTGGVAVLLLVAAVGVAVASWTDDFESYPAGQWPTSNWSPSGNGDGSIVTDVKHMGQKSFRLYGRLGQYWGTLAHRSIGTDAEYTIDFWIRNGAEGIPPYGHQTRGSIDLHTQPDWVPPAARIMDWNSDGHVHGRGGLLLGTYSTLTWYHVRVLYERNASTVHLEYWIDGDKKGEENLPASSSEMDFDYIALTAGAGTVWYDDVSVTAGTGPEPPLTLGDGVWISRAFADYNQFEGEVFDEYLRRMLSELESHSIRELYLDVINLNNCEWNPEVLRERVSSIKLSYRAANVYAHVHGRTDDTKNPLRLSRQDVRTRIAGICDSLCDVVGFDGIDLDIEPIHASGDPEPDDSSFEYFLTLLREIDSVLPESAALSATLSPRLPLGDFGSVSQESVKICVMMYDMGRKQHYDDTVKATSERILRAVRYPNMVSIALPAWNSESDVHDPNKEKLSSGIKGVVRANPKPASIMIYAPSSYEGTGYSAFDVDCRDPYNNENEWFVFDSLWHSDGRTGNVRILGDPSGELSKDTLSITVSWELPPYATHANLHWSCYPKKAERSQYVGLSGEGPVHTLGGVYNETIKLPTDSFELYGIQSVYLQAHAKIGDYNWYSKMKYVKLASGNSGGGQGSETVDVPVANSCDATFPDPFSDATRICYSVGSKAGSEAPVALSIVDRAGRVVRRLVYQTRPAGAYSATWDGRDDSGRKLPAGVYLYRLNVGEFSTTRKMVKMD
jgi:hypothetical protein